jgi:hypothetical protein
VPTIFRKIDQSAVFVADVTLVGESWTLVKSGETPKKLMNSNVAIEYGYALQRLTDARILMVQNVHYGDRGDLPFDLRHKAGPIQFRLSPEGTKAEIANEHARLRGEFKNALRPYIRASFLAAARQQKFQETPSTANIASYWDPLDVLAAHDLGVTGRLEDTNKIEYRFSGPTAFYLRVKPTSPLSEPLGVTRLTDTVRQRRMQVLTSSMLSGTHARNRFGAIRYEQRGNSAELTAFTQLFRNGEIWGVTSEFVGNYLGFRVVAMVHVRNITGRVLSNFIEVAIHELDVELPIQVEMGAVGLKDLRLSLPQAMQQWDNAVSEPIFEDSIQFKQIIKDTSEASQLELIDHFIRIIYDLAAIAISQ